MLYSVRCSNMLWEQGGQTNQLGLGELNMA